MERGLVPCKALLHALLLATTSVGSAQDADPSAPGVDQLLNANEESLVVGSLPAAGSPEPHTGIVSSADDVPIHFTTYGAGTPALLFVHGISCDQSYWSKQVEQFSGDFQVVSVDLAGHGKSGLGRSKWSMEAYGEDVVAVVEGLDLQNVVLIGHSMGSPVILEAARQLTEQVVGIVSVDAFTSLDTWWTPEEIEQQVNPFRRDFVRVTRGWVEGMFTEESDPPAGD